MDRSDTSFFVILILSDSKKEKRHFFPSIIHCAARHLMETRAAISMFSSVIIAPKEAD